MKNHQTEYNYNTKQKNHKASTIKQSPNCETKKGEYIEIDFEKLTTGGTKFLIEFDLKMNHLLLSREQNAKTIFGYFQLNDTSRHYYIKL